MPAKPDNSKNLAYRLTQILVKLNKGEKLDPQALADEFGVTRRSVQRDLHERFDFLSLIKTDGCYHLPPMALGKLNLRDIGHFASLAGVRGLFPSLSDDFLRDFFDSRIQNPLLIRGHHYEALGSKQYGFQQLEQAILARNTISYTYQKIEGIKTYTGVEPYKLVNQGGIWYLAGKDGDKLKSFSFAKIDRLQISGNTYHADPAVEKTLAEEDDVWLNDKKTEVVLKVSKEVADYFRRSKQVANQKIEKELEDGGLIVSTKVAHFNQILPTVRHWIPHIRIISPEGLQGEMESEILDYLAAH